MKKIGSKILSLVLVAFLSFGLAPMTTYAAETTNQETNNLEMNTPGTSSRETTVLEAGEISVTTYPSAIKITNKSEKVLFVKVQTMDGDIANGINRDEWIYLGIEGTEGGEIIIAPLAGGNYKVSYCYLKNDNSGPTGEIVGNPVVVEVKSAGDEPGAINAADEYVIDYKNATHIYVVSANDDESKALCVKILEKEGNMLSVDTHNGATGLYAGFSYFCEDDEIKE
jgi:hypothetical protein